ncbi:MAG: peptidoglycan-binding domain-containing protein [Candidatus Omnitrophota bacterium]
MKYAVVVMVIFFSICVFGCGQKETDVTQMPEPLSMEELSTLTGSPAITAEPKAQVSEAQNAKPGDLAPLPPAGPYKPTNIEIQTALKNAGYYAGEIDGKAGPMTKKAIEEFQKANSLKVDGKVGPQTWEVLSTQLNPEPVKKKRR